jgi:hypothetical protein
MRCGPSLRARRKTSLNRALALWICQEAPAAFRLDDVAGASEWRVLSDFGSGYLNSD